MVRILVMQWNIWTEKAENILRTLQAVRPDFVCMQKASANMRSNPDINVARWVAQRMGYYCFYAAGDCLEKEGRIEFHGNAILSHFPLHTAQSLSIKHPNDQSNPWDKSPRVYLEAEVVLAGGNLTIATTHGSYCDRFRNDEIKNPEMDRLMQAMCCHQERYILSTDLNSLPNSYSVARIKEVLQDCGPCPTVPTWPTKPQTFADWNVEELQYRIDYVFSTPDLQSYDAKVIQTSYSDHLPILCTFEV